MVTRTLLVAFCARLVGVRRQKHRLPVLLCLERTVIICFVSLVLASELGFAAILLAIGAVEGAVGLGCVVGLTRAGGRAAVSVAGYMA